MGQLRITIGAVSGTRTVNDAKLQEIATIIYEKGVLPGWPEGTPLPANAQERLQAVVDFIALEIREIARGYKRREIDIADYEAKQVALAEIDVTP
jgi:hypothetical protein